MFNMENTAAKEDRSSHQLFDLEKDMQDLSKAQEIKANVQDKVQNCMFLFEKVLIKPLLRSNK